MTHRKLRSISERETFPMREQDLFHVLSTYVKNHLADTDLEQHIALAFDIDHEQLSLLLERACGQTLKEFILQERMRAAQRMLLESSSRVQEIARAVGYPSASALSQVFHRQVGMAPSTFRKTASVDVLTLTGGALHWG